MLNNAARKYQWCFLKMTIKSWKMLELRTVLIDWWFCTVWVHLSVFIWYSATSARMWTWKISLILCKLRLIVFVVKFPVNSILLLLPLVLHSVVGFGLSLHFVLSVTSSLHLLTPNTWRSFSTSSLHLFLSLPLRLVPSSYWVKIVLCILSSPILSRWPNQLILCPFIHFTMFSPLLISSSSRFVLLFHSPFLYLGPYSK